jgi:hypothetical protein
MRNDPIRRLATANPVPHDGPLDLPESVRLLPRMPALGLAVALAALVSAGFAVAAGLGAFRTSMPGRASGRHSTSPITLPLSASGPAGKLYPATPVASVAAANALLSFSVVLPSNATPTQMSVYTRRADEFGASFDTPTESYSLVEATTTDWTVADLQRLAQTWPGAIHEIVSVSGVPVLVHGDPDGYTTAVWIRGEGESSVYTAVQGPGVAGQTFSEQDALSVAANIIAQGG